MGQNVETLGMGTVVPGLSPLLRHKFCPACWARIQPANQPCFCPSRCWAFADPALPDMHMVNQCQSGLAVVLQAQRRQPFSQVGLSHLVPGLSQRHGRRFAPDAGWTLLFGRLIGKPSRCGHFRVQDESAQIVWSKCVVIPLIHRSLIRP